MGRLSDLTEEESGQYGATSTSGSARSASDSASIKTAALPTGSDQRTERASTFAKRTCTFVVAHKTAQGVPASKSSRRQRTNLTSERSATLVQRTRQPKATGSRQFRQAQGSATGVHVVPLRRLSHRMQELRVRWNRASRRASVRIVRRWRRARNAEREIVPDAFDRTS